MAEQQRYAMKPPAAASTANPAAPPTTAPRGSCTDPVEPESESELELDGALPGYHIGQRAECTALRCGDEYAAVKFDKVDALRCSVI